MHGGEVLIPITIFAGGFAMIFGIVYLRTRENMAMIEKGINPKDKVHRPAPFRTLKWGLLFLGSGVGLFFAFLLHTNFYEENDAAAFIYFALLAIGGGLGLILSYIIEKKNWYDRKEE